MPLGNLPLISLEEPFFDCLGEVAKWVSGAASWNEEEEILCRLLASNLFCKLLEFIKLFDGFRGRAIDAGFVITKDDPIPCESLLFFSRNDAASML